MAVPFFNGLTTGELTFGLSFLIAELCSCATTNSELMTMTQTIFSVHEAVALAENACLAAGANPAMARSLAQATVSAARYGRASVGFPHLLDYLSSLRDGRINTQDTPRLMFHLPAIIHADAQGGIAQLGFDQAMPTFVERTQTLGIALFTQCNSYTTGELGYYVRCLALEGLLAFAVSNSPAVMAGVPGGKVAFGTNPMAFAAPLSDVNAPIVIDQAASATAFVNIVKAAAEEQNIPQGWAIDETGDATTSAQEALRGALLAFGGAKGANIALMVECLAAGLSSGAWSLDMPSFQTGSKAPNAGMVVIAISPTAVDEHFSARLSQQLERLAARGVYIPGRRSLPSLQQPNSEGLDHEKQNHKQLTHDELRLKQTCSIAIDDDTVRKIKTFTY